MHKKELKKLLITDIDKVVEFLIENLNEDSLFDEAVLLKARKADLDRSIQRGVLQQIEINIELNKIRGSTLNIINGLNEESTFKESEETEGLNVELSKDANQEIQLVEVDEGIEIISLEEDIESINIEEIGFMDVEELLLETTQNFTENLHRISQITNDLGNGISNDASRLESANKSNSGSKRMMQKNIINNAARTMDTYRKRMEIEIPLFKTLTEGTMKYSMLYIQKIYEYGVKKSRNEIDDYFAAIKDLYTSSINSKDSLLKMYEEIKKIPNMTSVFGVSKRRVINQLEIFFDIYDRFVGDLESLINSVEFMYLEISNEEE